MEDAYQKVWTQKREMERNIEFALFDLTCMTLKEQMRKNNIESIEWEDIDGIIKIENCEPENQDDTALRLVSNPTVRHFFGDGNHNLEA